MYFVFSPVDERGRWWIVGSAWTGASIASAAHSQDQTNVVQTTQFSKSLLELARKQRMNTDTRRNIFCILMTAEVINWQIRALYKKKI